ncbi:hypothetical protein GCM10027296_29300 [Chitinimonas naiadis]
MGWLLLLPTLLAAPATLADSYQRNLETLRKFVSADPDRLARKNARTGDYRFLALRGYITVVPALNRNNCELPAKEIRFLPGSSQDMWDSAHTKLGDKAYHFAERYNTAMIRLRPAAIRYICTPPK